MKNLLRSAALFIIFNCSFIITKAQWVSIPDSNFGNWLKTNGYSSCLQGNSTVGWQLNTSSSVVINATQMQVIPGNILSLNGLQYFTHLTFLNCEGNHLNALPVLPNSLTYLDCSNNGLTSLATLPNGLIHLNCAGSNLSVLPALPNSLSYLDCSVSSLDSITTLPTALTELYCANNPLHFLPTLPDSLAILFCYNSHLSSLPSFPNSLKKLLCHDNQLSSLPLLPNSLFELDCSGNNLTILPNIPDSLVYLICCFNHLSSIPALPNSLTYLRCCINNLTALPELPDSLYVFDCHANPNLHCLPRLKRVVTLSFDSASITCVPNYGNVTSSSPSLANVPICNIFNTNGCATAYWNIKGMVYADTNMNCLFNAGEQGISNLKVNLYQGGNLLGQANSIGGEYSFDTDLSDYQYSIDTSNSPFYMACPDSGYYTSVITPLDSFDSHMDFGLRCKPGFDLVAQSMDARFRLAHVNAVTVSVGDASNFYNAHCAAGTSGNVQVIINGAAHYASAASGALTPTSVVNDTITWSIADFGAVNFFHDFNINVATDTTAVLGSQICFTLIVNPIAGDNNPANNILTHCFTVVGSFDPNEKEVYPAGNIDTATHWLTYTIHFQNTGTAEAQHIYVTDTLDSNVDVASFQLLAYSHQPMVQLKGNNLRFNFPNINLPDSNTNEPLSHGYVQYKVKLKDNLPIGTNINNTAFIYFDFNAPVVTNTTSNTIALATGVANLGLRNADFGLNPNPATESVRISIDESMIGSNLTITDITGREVLHSTVQIPARTTDDVQSGGRNPQFDIRNLSPGVYFVTLENKTGRVTKKLVKQ